MYASNLKDTSHRALPTEIEFKKERKYIKNFTMGEFKAIRKL